MKKIIWFVLLQLLSVSILFAQGKPYEGPDDPAGDVEIEREGYMIGNRIRLYFQNNTELAKWTETYRGSQWSRWSHAGWYRSFDWCKSIYKWRFYTSNKSDRYRSR